MHIFGAYFGYLSAALHTCIGLRFMQRASEPVAVIRSILTCTIIYANIVYANIR